MELVITISVGDKGHKTITGIKTHEATWGSSEIELERIQNEGYHTLQTAWHMDLARAIRELVDAYVGSERYNEVKKAVISLYSSAETPNCLESDK